MGQTVTARVGLAMLLVALGACSSEAPGASDRLVTYYQDLKPVIDSKCATCHVEGGIGGFALTTYEQAKQHAGMMKLATKAGTMPPWSPDDECNQYRGHRGITDEQRAMFTTWSDAGAPVGDATAPGAALPHDVVTLSRTDKTLGMPEAYVPQTTVDAPDDYHCFVLPWNEATTKYVTGFRAVPGNGEVVHHVIAYLASPSQVAGYQTKDANEAGPGYTCFGGSGGPSNQWIGAWVPGSNGSDFPGESGLKIEPGSAIILQMHYNVSKPNPRGDKTTLQFRLANSVGREAMVLPYLNPLWVKGKNMHIAAGDAEASHSFSADPTPFLGMLSPAFQNVTEFDIYGVGLHMHQLGKSGELYINRASEDQCLLKINQWDFHWQGTYDLKQPVRFKKGDRLDISCTWDNSATKQPSANGRLLPPKDVAWGEGTSDEMCLGTLYIAKP